MKQMTMRAVTHKAILVWLTGLCLALMVTSISWAQEITDMMEDHEAEGVVVGSFDGVDLKARRVWVDDMVYVLDRGVKVKGTSTKLGLMRDLKMGERVKVTLQPNEETPSIPYVVLIERL